jgi:sugar phosphate isomerase/epimerase
MNHTLNRRGFLKRCGLTIAGTGILGSVACAVEPFKRSGAPRLLLSLAAYSFRDDFATNERVKKTESKRIDLFQFIDFCAEHGCAGTELTSYYFPKEVDSDYLLKLRRHAFLRGIEISGTAVGNNFAVPPGPKRDAEIASVKKWVDHASIMGAPHIRIFAGAPQGISKEEAKKLCASAIDECAEYAGKKGIFLGLENHGGIVAEPEDLLDIIRAVKSPWVGINLDTGNFHTDDPYRDLALCAPYTVNAQVKSEMSKRGGKKEPADLARLIRILRDVNYQGYVALEYEAAEDPWKAVPGLLKQLKELCA